MQTQEAKVVDDLSRYFIRNPLRLITAKHILQPQINAYSLDHHALRYVYNHTYPRQPKARNPRGEYINSVVGYRYFFFTYHGNDRPVLYRIPNMHAYYLGYCVNDRFHWHGMFFTTLHYKQTHMFTMITVRDYSLLDVQAAYNTTKRATHYIREQTPKHTWTKMKTNIYGNWDQDFDTDIALEPQHEGSTTPWLSQQNHDLPNIGGYNPDREAHTYIRVIKKYIIKFQTTNAIKTFLKYISKAIMTEKDIFTVKDNQYQSKYSNEPIVYIKYQLPNLAFFENDMSLQKRKNNVFLIISMMNYSSIQYTTLPETKKYDVFTQQASDSSSFIIF
jgi:hypothetical protein